MDGVPNVNLEIHRQMMVACIIALNANHKIIQQFHVEFCYLIKFCRTIWITTKEGKQNEKSIKKGLIKYNFKDTSIF